VTPRSTPESWFREYDRRHGEHADLRALGEVLRAILRVAWWCLRILARFPAVTCVVALFNYGYWAYGHTGPALLGAVLLVGLLAWRLVDGDSFSQFVTWRVWSSWRAWRTYGRRWDSAMTMAGLGDRYLGNDYVPVLRRARCRPDLDRLTVQLLQGQHPDDFAAQADTLAHTFGALSCRSRIAGPGVVTLEFTKADRLAGLRPCPRRHRAPRPGRRGLRPPRGRPGHDRQSAGFAHPDRRGHRRRQGLGAVVADPRPRPPRP
jgi:hypothetical protein